MTQPATKAVDIVGVFDVNWNQLFPLARPLKSSIKEDSTFFTHPIEDSTVIADHVIKNPVEISMPLLLSGEGYESVFKVVQQTHNNHTQLIVKTKVNAYENMYIQAIPHEESAENFDSVIMNLAFIEAKVAPTEIVFIPASQENSDTVNRGQQEPGDLTDNQQQRATTAKRVFGRFLN